MNVDLKQNGWWVGGGGGDGGEGGLTRFSFSYCWSAVFLLHFFKACVQRNV